MCYLGHNKEDYIINFDDVSIGYSKKDKAKDVLLKNFKEGED